MDTFTCITENRACSHLTQQAAAAPMEALRMHIGELTSDDDDMSEEELDWLAEVADGKRKVVLIAVPSCPNVWLWRDGDDREPKYSTYIVKTDVK
jgi:hypothetical protein